MLHRCTLQYPQIPTHYGEIKETVENIHIGTFDNHENKTQTSSPENSVYHRYVVEDNLLNCFFVLYG